MSQPGYTRPSPAGDYIASGPETIKALTHPLRLRLHDLLHRDNELTATQCARLTGESVASCSFHLRQLEKYGYVERAESRGKERPWRLARRALSVRPDLSDPEALAAARAFAGVWFAEQIAAYRRWLDQFPHDDLAWLSASTSVSQHFWVTRDELDDLSRTVEQVTERFAGRDDPAQRPPGARRAHLLGAAWAEIPGPDEQQR